MIKSALMHVSHGEESVPVECWHMSQYAGEIKALTVSGNARHIGMTLNAIREGCEMSVGQFVRLETDDFDYEVIASRVMQKDFIVVHVRSSDPKCLWTNEPGELFKALMARPFETPLLPRWMPAFRAALDSRKLIFKMTGHNPIGSILSVDLTPRKLDELASIGTSKRKLNLR